MLCGEMAQWFYGENGQPAGPVDDAEFSSLIASQRINPATMVWREGMSGWLPLSQVRANGGLFPQPTPMMIGMMNPPTSGLATASLVLGITSFVVCGLLGIPAVICGHMALNQIDNSALPMGGRGMAIAGLVCGYLINLLILAIVVVFVSIGFNH